MGQRPSLFARVESPQPCGHHKGALRRPLSASTGPIGTRFCAGKKHPTMSLFHLVMTILVGALFVSLLLNVIQVSRARVLSVCHSWGVWSQGAWRWRQPFYAALAWFRPVDVIHFDIDHLKKLNTALGEARVNQLLRLALRGNDIYRLQEGDELVALTWAGRGQPVAQSIHLRLHDLSAHMTITERLAVGDRKSVV